MAHREPTSGEASTHLPEAVEAGNYNELPDGEGESSQAPIEVGRCGPGHAVQIRNTFVEIVDGPKTRSDAQVRSRSESDRSSESSGTRLWAGRGPILMLNDLNKSSNGCSSSSSRLLRPLDPAARATAQAAPDEAEATPEAALPSVGSAGHEASECRACIYHATAEGCRHGRACAFCHFPHERKRLSKSKRAQVKHLVQRFCDHFPADLEQTLALLLHDSSTEGKYVSSIIRSRIHCSRPQETRMDGQRQEVAEAILQGLTHRDFGETASRALANVCRKHGKKKSKKREACDVGEKVSL